MKRFILTAILILGCAYPCLAADKPAAIRPDIKASEAYVRIQAREAYFWGWPMANMLGRRLMFNELTEPVLLDGIVPAAPPNRLAMLTDYIDPAERAVACPNQDVIYGAAILALDKDALVVQVPDFGERFWVYQMVDIRTESFGELGKMYASQPGFYLLAGPNWQGEIPAGITTVFKAKSDTGIILPRVFINDTPEDKRAVQALLDQIDVYPLAEYTGKMRINDWSKLPIQPSGDNESQGETKWVTPETFFDLLPMVLADAQPLPGEEALYAQFGFLGELAKNNPDMRAVMIDEARKADTEMIDPLLQLSSFGLDLNDNWSTIANGAAFGYDYFTRTAVARSNIFVNKTNETKYFYLDFDAAGERLDGSRAYSVTFAPGQVPVNGFWSLTLYDEYHFFAPNNLNRYSIGTKSPGLVYNADGSLTLYIQNRSPGKDKEVNWLPAPADKPFSLYIRAYWPKPETLDGRWTPPAVQVIQ